MTIASIVLTSLLAAVLIISAALKLSHRPEVVAQYERVGVPKERLDYLAAILLAGAAGLIVGLFWSPLGIAAAVGVVIYFALAIVAHIHARDTEHVAVPVVVELLAVATLAVQLASA
ncbi:DoxX family protein [Nocardia cyriacigeorgica]|uniref:DoxX family protein n=1 Tax=Nocardia cyriacigeorgica TaxID=135487 RepID=A0ABX0CGA5_9NOCA|nr:DoxX family protein [Nocardia cyriacigeorgica]NEW55583.1 DoxX family protein [Nocardia cyriacigeorgica]